MVYLAEEAAKNGEHFELSATTGDPRLDSLVVATASKGELLDRITSCYGNSGLHPAPVACYLLTQKCLR
jgi:hypothetical protein